MGIAYLIHVLVVADACRDRAAVRRLVWPEADISVAGEAANSAEALEALRLHRYDVVVLDLSRPDRQAATLLAQIARDFPDVPVIGLVGSAARIPESAAAPGPAWTILAKEESGERLVGAIRRAAFPRGDGGVAAAFVPDAAPGALHQPRVR